jgi:hypothetical protein
MSNKDFKVKNGLQVPSLTTAGIVTTSSSGVISSSTTVSIENGGTGQTSANNALNALLPVQSGSTVNYAIQSDGTNVSWAKVYNQLVQNAGISVSPRRNLNFVGAAFTDNSGTDTTTVTFPTNASLRQTFTPTSGQTSFTLSAEGIIGSEQVFLNGILLVKDSDYTTPDTTTILLASGAAVGDVLDVMILNDITSSGILSTYKQEINLAISSNTTLVTGYRYFVDTSAARTLTLPANPSVGNEIVILDAIGTAGTYNITLNSNSKKINGTVQNFTIDVDGAGASLIYTGSTYGWRVG